MNIGIIGTRGIPNEYGGFEQFAEYLSIGLVKKGHTVSVYSSHNHTYKEDNLKGVEIIHKYDPEYKIGTIGQFIYDLNCILDSRKRNFDIILQLGYTSSSIWSFLFPKKSYLFTNMDGLEWKRTKFSENVKKFLLFAEKLAIDKSHFLIADSPVIQKYIKDTYNKESEFIAYGTNIPNSFNHDVLKKYNLSKHNYDLLIARIEPENHIHMILEGVKKSNVRKFIVIGKVTNEYAKNLEKTYSSDKIVFLGGIYNIEYLNDLRYYSNLYFHGHSVGGTNPSLLEAMACSTLICAHDNDFNKEILKNNAYYFKNSEEVKDVIKNRLKTKENPKLVGNLSEVKIKYTWKSIISKYENYFIENIKSED